GLQRPAAPRLAGHDLEGLEVPPVDAKRDTDRVAGGLVGEGPDANDDVKVMGEAVVNVQLAAGRQDADVAEALVVPWGSDMDARLQLAVGVVAHYRPGRPREDRLIDNALGGGEVLL